MEIPYFVLVGNSCTVGLKQIKCGTVKDHVHTSFI
jgi:hypothetical protein